MNIVKAGGILLAKILEKVEVKKLQVVKMYLINQQYPLILVTGI